MEWWEAALRLLTAVVIGCTIGIERERKMRPAGMRTHVLVCVGAAMVAILECYNLTGVMALDDSQATISMGRLSAQVVSGIGFLGAGTIFISQKKIAGLTTAASLWNVACLGLVCGMGHYVLAIAGAVIVLVALALLQKVVRVNTIKNVEIKFIHRSETIAFINQYFEHSGIKVIDVDFHMENKGKFSICTNTYTLDIPSKTSYKDVVSALSEYSNIQSIRTRNS